jgi:lysyl-tRNA synthetase class 2
MSNGYTPENDLIAQRLAKANAVREAGGNPFANGFRVTHTADQIFAAWGETPSSALESEPVEVRVAGRVRFRRIMGKAGFLKIQDWTVREGLKPRGIVEEGEPADPSDDFLQLYLRSEEVGEEAFARFKNLDLGDIVAAVGTLMRTRTGELTVHLRELVLLTKSLRPLPDKWHGLSDIETRIRQRYVDFVMNDRAREIMRIRSQIIRLTRDFFHERRYLEVETPMLHSTPGGATARPFGTHHNALDMPLFLRIAPELFLKRLLVGGLGRVFEIGRVFRNEGIDRDHNPEFTMLEFYEAYATYEDLMELTEQLISGLALAIHGTTTIPYGEHTIELAAPWRRLTVAEATAEYAGVPLESLSERANLLALAKRYGVAEEDATKMGDGKLLMTVFEEAAEPHLVQPTFVTHYPTEVSPLSRPNDADPTYVDRFEGYIACSEICNAFSELNDPVDQHARFEAQLVARAAGDDEAHPMDSDYVRALEYGMPPAAGEGIGIDRLVMLLANAPNIREVIAFPLLRPEA